MGTKPKGETRPPDEELDDDEGGDDEHQDEGGDRAGGADDERLAQRIEATVRRVLGGLLGGGEVDVADGEGGKGEDEKPAPAPRGAAAVEDDMEGRVRRALDSIRSDEDKEDRMKKLEETVFAERPPVKQRRAERVMWGPPRG